MAESDSRSTFVKNIVSLYKKMGVDGVDIDWEYPGQEGDGNKFSPDDTANYLLFLRALRKALPSKAKITAAVTPEPWVDETGSPAKDLKDFAEVLDWVLIMNYDVNVREYCLKNLLVNLSYLPPNYSATAVSRTKRAFARRLRKREKTYGER